VVDEVLEGRKEFAWAPVSEHSPFMIETKCA